jgi:hypothetical protein
MFKKKQSISFVIDINIVQLVDYPLLNSIVFVKWKVAGGAAAGTTGHAAIGRDHTVHFTDGDKARVEVTVPIANDTKELAPVWFKASVRAETKGGRGHRPIGQVVVNLSTWAKKAKDASSAVVTQRHLLENALDNSALELQFSMVQVGGETTDWVPAPHEVPTLAGGTGSGGGAGLSSTVDDGEGVDGAIGRDEARVDALLAGVGAGGRPAAEAVLGDVFWLRDDSRITPALAATRPDAADVILDVVKTVLADE